MAWVHRTAWYPEYVAAIRTVRGEAGRMTKESVVLKRRFILAAPLAIAAVVLAACGGSSGGSNGSSGGNKKTYKIALQAPLSGGNQQLGLNIAYGVQLAINQANASGNLPFK